MSILCRLFIFKDRKINKHHVHVNCITIFGLYSCTEHGCMRLDTRFIIRILRYLSEKTTHYRHPVL